MNNYFRTKALNLLRWYKKSLSPKIASRGIRCLYKPSCGDYAIIQFNDRPLIIAFIKTLLRLLSCNPINALIKENRQNG